MSGANDSSTVSSATRMRDAGRSWTEIAERLKITVREAKAQVEQDKAARRTELSHSQVAEDRNGLRDRCSQYECGHPRKAHQEFSGGCTAEGCGCDEFVHRARSLLPWYRLPVEEDPEYVDPDVRLHDHVAIQALQLGVPRKVRPTTEEEVEHRRRLGGPWAWYGSTIPQPTLARMVRRARKKLAAGKPVKKHYDRPRRGDL